MSPLPQYHKEISEAMSTYRGKELTTREIREIVLTRHPGLLPGFVIPSDHRVNGKPKESCACCGTESALFEQLGRGVYRVR